MTVTRLPFLAHHPPGRPPAGEAASWSRLTAFPLQCDPPNRGTGPGEPPRQSGDGSRPVPACPSSQARSTGPTEPPVLVPMSSGAWVAHGMADVGGPVSPARTVWLGVVSLCLWGRIIECTPWGHGHLEVGRMALPPTGMTAGPGRACAPFARDQSGATLSVGLASGCSARSRGACSESRGAQLAARRFGHDRRTGSERGSTPVH
jgi:hypothetical protein